MSKSTEIVVCQDAEAVLWDGYVERSPRATIAHKFSWRSIISRTYGHRPFYLMACSGRTVRGILPLFLVESAWFGTSLTSMPFLDYGGVCSDDAETGEALVRYALALRRNYAAGCLELRHVHALPGEGGVRVDKVSLVLDISPGADAVWQALQAKVRNQVRKAQKEGLTFAYGSGELLDEFYSVFLVNMHDLGSPVHDRRFFANILADFGHEVLVMVVRDHGRPIGGAVCLLFRDIMHVPWASSLRESFTKCPNNLLYWEAINYACEHGYRWFDFGRSSVGSGTYHFKGQWGAEPRQLHWQILGGNGSASSARSPADPRYRPAVALWKRLPLPVTKWVGPRIRKYLTN